MPIIIAVFITAAVVGPAGYFVNVWWPRKRGAHGRYDPNYSVDVLKVELEDNRVHDEQSHRQAMARVTTPHVTDVSDSDTRLIAPKGQPRLLCGNYGGTAPQPEWPTEVIA
jgi:hypothetical protein